MVLINNFHDTPPKIQIPKIKINLSKHFYTISFNTHRFLCQTHGFEVKNISFKRRFQRSKNGFFTLLKTSFLESQKI